MQNVWSEVLRCVSRWELLQQLHSGGPTDALLFSPPPAESPASNPLMKLRDRLLMRAPAAPRPFGGNNSCLLLHPDVLSFTLQHNAVWSRFAGDVCPDLPLFGLHLITKQHYEASQRS